MGLPVSYHGWDERLTKSQRFPHVSSLDAVTSGRNRVRSKTQWQFPH